MSHLYFQFDRSTQKYFFSNLTWGKAGAVWSSEEKVQRRQVRNHWSSISYEVRFLALQSTILSMCISQNVFLLISPFLLYFTLSRPTPIHTEGGMTLYVKAGPDGTSLGDCPFAHFVRMVLDVKGLEYELKPCIQTTKPDWLLEFYEGKMPALRHRKECYVESDTIAAYLDFFFPQPELTPPDVKEADAAATAMDGLFPAFAQYMKHTTTGDDIDMEKKTKMCACLHRLNDYLSLPGRTGPYMVGDGSVMRMVDCKLGPVLYQLCNAIPAYKGGVDAIQFLEQEFPAVKAYADYMFQSDPSFQKTVYPPEVLVWGWGNARNKQ
jgi:glutathione S-transferase